MSTLIIKLYEANTDRILHVLNDELERGSTCINPNLGAYHLLIKDGTPLDPTDGSPHLAPERDEAMLYAAAPDMFAALQAWHYAYSECTGTDEERRDAKTKAGDMTRAAIAKATKP